MSTVGEALIPSKSERELMRATTEKVLRLQMCIRDRSKYNFKASISGVSFSVNGNKLTVSMDTAPSKEFTITATKKNAVRRGVVVWSEMCIRDR